MHIIKFALLAALAGCTIPAIAQWQWIDGQGQKVFSDRAPPVEIPAKNILRSPSGPSAFKSVAPAPTEAATANAKPSADKGIDKGLEEQKRKQEAQETAKVNAEKLQREKQRQENCNRAKQSKATLASGSLLSTVNANGERSFMDEATRNAELKRADAAIASECGPSPTPTP